EPAIGDRALGAHTVNYSTGGRHGAKTHQLEQDPRGRLRPQVAGSGDRVQRRQAGPIPWSFARSPPPVHGRAFGDELFRGQDRREFSLEPDKVSAYTGKA